MTSRRVHGLDKHPTSEELNMRIHRNPRLQRLEQLIAASPLNSGVLDAAVATLRSTGRLPQEERLATAVVDRVRDEPSTAQDHVNLEGGLRRLAELVRLIEAGTPPAWHRDELRKQILFEAIESGGLVREIARLALVILAAAGMDLTKPLALGEMIAPTGNGTAGMRVLGSEIVKPPHLADARRLLKRAAKVGELRPTSRPLGHPRFGLMDPTQGPPVPDTPTLVAGMKRLVDLATEFGLVGAGEAG